MPNPQLDTSIQYQSVRKPLIITQLVHLYHRFTPLPRQRLWVLGERNESFSLFFSIKELLREHTAVLYCTDTMFGFIRVNSQNQSLHLQASLSSRNNTHNAVVLALIGGCANNNFIHCSTSSLRYNVFARVLRTSTRLWVRRKSVSSCWIVFAGFFLQKYKSWTLRVITSQMLTIIFCLFEEVDATLD